MEAGSHLPTHVIGAGVVGLLLILFAWIAHRKLKFTESCLIPSDKPTPSTLFEVAVEMILGLMEGVLGEKAWRYFPLIGSLFIYIFVCNIMGLIPGLEPPTGNTNTNASCAAVVFFYYNYVGIKEQGIKNYLRHFMGPSLGKPAFYLIPLVILFHLLMFGVETISHIVRPGSLSVRLFGNMTGDHMVLGLFSDLLPFLVPIIFLILGLFISFIQAFVFSLLSIVYLGLATESSDH